MSWILFPGFQIVRRSEKREDADLIAVPLIAINTLVIAYELVLG